jgi:hypothetical protein
MMILMIVFKIYRNPLMMWEKGGAGLCRPAFRPAKARGFLEGEKTCTENKPSPI